MRRPVVCSAPLSIVLVLASFAVPSALPIGAPRAAAATFNEPPAPQGIGFSQVVAGAGHTCGLADNGMGLLLGQECLRPTRRWHHGRPSDTNRGERPDRRSCDCGRFCAYLCSPR
ncbi:hypothetical protein [Chloroflexus sp.]|uniref:hypothetical protein n=1 Tax=Chloroflexus sp. TaxID=1904827 RepID=UPI003A1006D6